MTSIAFPTFLNTTSTILYKDHEATASNLKLTLLSMKNELFGDPYFGTNIQKLMFEQNNSVLKDIIIDDFYTAIVTFMPQLVVKREDIDIDIDGRSVLIKIKALNLIDYVVDNYSISLMGTEEI